MTFPPLFRLLFLTSACLLGAVRPTPPPGCEPDGPVALDAASLTEANLLALLTQHRPRYTSAQLEAVRAAMDRCNTASADALNVIEVEKSSFSLRLQELLRYGDVVKLRERIETLRKSRAASVQELERNLAATRQVGLYVVLLEKVDIYAPQKDLRTQAQTALSPRAVSDLNGVFVRRSTEATDLKAVQDIIQSFAGGEASEDQVLFDKTNFEAGKDYYLYFAKISVRPLKKSPVGAAGAASANATVLNLDIDKNYQTQLSARGVIAPHLTEIGQRAASYAELVRRENDDAARRRDNILTAGQDELRRLDRDIEDAERDLRNRAGKIESICRELGLPFSAGTPDQSATQAAQKLRDQIAALETRWNQTKEQEIQYVDTKVTIEESPAKDFADEALKLSRKLEQQYGKVQKTEEIVRLEDLQVAELSQAREVELYRRLRQIWVYPVGESDGTFRLYVFGAFSISGRKEVGAPAVAVPEHMVLVKGGTFEMGCTSEQQDCADDEKPVHRVTVSDFYLGKMEVTFNEYDAFCSATSRTKPTDEGLGRGQRPITQVSWYDAVEYCIWRSQQEGLRPFYRLDKRVQDPNNTNTDSDDPKWEVVADFSANGYRLPTEAEWEFAARQGGQKVLFGNGKNMADPREINFDARSVYKTVYSIAGEYKDQSLPAGSFAPNSLGLYDMSGNVWEWCHDWKEPYPATLQTNPRGPTTGSDRVVRSGGYWNRPHELRVSRRYGSKPQIPNIIIGFRLARSF